MKNLQSFDGANIAYHDEGEGSPVILLHAYGVDGSNRVKKLWAELAAENEKSDAK